jgi:solute carrier family 25 (adenine nucleotide translocator) protein 4/5/6/31
MGTLKTNAPGDFEKFVTALLTGGTASAVAKTIVAPFERVRLILQTQTLVPGQSEKPFKGAVDALVHLVREQGFASLWRGNVPNLLRIVPTYGLRFTLFDYFKDLAALGSPEGKPLSLPRQMASGALSGFTTVLVTYPLDFARTRMSASSSPSHNTIAGTLRTVYAKEGVQGLYRGLFVSALEITPYLAISLGGYEYLKGQLSPTRDTPTARLGAAWIAGLAGSLTCFPVDTVKRRMMLDGSPGFAGSGNPLDLRGGRGAWSYIQSMYDAGGIRIFYRGCLLNAGKSASGVALTFVCNDIIKDYVADMQRG